MTSHDEAGHDELGHDVVVVGAGPVGLLLAGELARRRVRVLVLEALARPDRATRASTLHARTMELLDQCGLGAALAGAPREDRGHFGGIGLDLSGVDSRYAGQWKVPQPRLVELLEEWATGHGARVRRGRRVTGVGVVAAHVEVTHVGGDGVPRATRGRFVVGCDGEDSTVRRAAGIELVGTGPTRELLAADVDGIEVPDRRFERIGGRLVVASRRRDGLTRLMVAARARADTTAPVEFADVARAWREVTGEDVTGGRAVWLHAFRDVSRQAERYRDGRVLLAGDAAHHLLPAGGQALNLGLADAVNLGWKLAAEVTGTAPDGLLDSYHTERYAAGERARRTVAAQARLLLEGAEVDATRKVLAELVRLPRVERRLAEQVSGLDTRYGREDGDAPAVGERCPLVRVVTPDGPRDVAELLRPGLGVLLAEDPAVGALADRWTGRVLSVPVTVPVAAGAVDPGGTPGPVSALLLRPDGHVAWAGASGTTGEGLETALRRWFGDPAPAQHTRARGAQNTDGGTAMTEQVMTKGGTERSGPVHECDVVILGSGLAGAVGGAILARHGADVALIDAATHPRFAIGESMTPQLVEWLHVLAARYDVPEIAHLLDLKATTEHVTPMHGRKQHFGFIRHEPGKEPDPEQANMFIIPSVLTESSHLFRQDTDAYFFHVAARYGCTTRQNWRAVDLEFDDDGVDVIGQNGEVFRGKYLIDASGFRSPLAEKFDLREKPARFKHHARSLFTHYVGVKPFDEVSHHPASLRPPALWNSGTLHHLIERGWFWIIPFNNHDKSQNPLCSVGLTFDERLYPKPKDKTPEEEFQYHLDRYPAIKRQFEGARRVREWVSTDRLQYSSKQSIGYRWCLTSHAAGFLDPLYSRGLSNTFEVLDALCSRVLEALQDDDWSVERFEYVERLERGLLHYNDELVNASYISFSHYRLFNAVFRVWASFITPATLRLTRARLNFALDGDDRHFKELENAPYPGLWWPETPDLKQILELTAEMCEKYEAGQIDGDSAADAVFAALNASPYVNPVFGWKDPESTRFVKPTPAMMARFMWWASVQAPPELRSIGRSMASGIVKSGLRGRKLL